MYRDHLENEDGKEIGEIKEIKVYLDWMHHARLDLMDYRYLAVDGDHQR